MELVTSTCPARRLLIQTVWGSSLDVMAAESAGWNLLAREQLSKRQTSELALMVMEIQAEPVR